MRGRGQRLEVNPIQCDAHGLCAELLPEWVRLDDWGYPMIEEGAMPAHLVPLARKAVAACPTLALKLQPVVEAPARTAIGSRRP